MRYFRNNDKSTLRSGAHVWAPCAHRNLWFRYAHFCPKKKSSERGCSELKFKQKSRSHDSKKLLLRILPSSIQTILSVPESHRFLRGCARGLYRRSGIAPCPEDIFRFYCYVLLLSMLLLQSRIVKRKIFLRGGSFPISNKAPAWKTTKAWSTPRTKA